MGVALVTGPTSGIGREIAVELSRQGHELILVSRDEAALNALARQLGNARVLVADLSDRAALARVEQEVVGVDWLVNNAGYGLNADFTDSDVEQEQALLDVLVTAVMRLCHAALPSMVQRGQGRILNVSSVAGWVPFGTYSAAKSWVTVFSESMAAQTPDGVHVTALCPGFTHTGFHERAGMDVQVPEWMWLNAADVAREGVRDCKQGKVLSVPGLQYKSLAAATRVMPRAVMRKVSSRRERG